jgi:hypothetical protein
MKKTTIFLGASLLVALAITSCGSSSNDVTSAEDSSTAKAPENVEPINDPPTTKESAKTDLPIIKASSTASDKYKDWGSMPTESEDGPTDGWTWWSMMCEGIPGQLKASSVLASQGKKNYDVKNLSDDDPTTAWVEGSADYGIGEFFEYSDYTLSGDGTIHVLNGYQSSKSSWENNSRVKRLEISYNGKGVCVVELLDQMGIQTFSLPEALASGGVLRLTIADVYPGLKFKDTAISGVFSCGG